MHGSGRRKAERMGEVRTTYLDLHGTESSGAHAERKQLEAILAGW